MQWLQKIKLAWLALVRGRLEADREGMKAFLMTDHEKVETLRRYCTGEESEADREALYEGVLPHTVVRRIGEILHERGGIEEMRRFFTEVGPVPGIHKLANLWDGIGEWKIVLPASVLDDTRSGSHEIGGTLRATISIEGEPIEAEFSDAVIHTTDDEGDNDYGNFDLTVRVNQAISPVIVVDHLFVKMPWGEKDTSVEACGSYLLEGVRELSCANRLFSSEREIRTYVDRNVLSELNGSPLFSRRLFAKRIPGQPHLLPNGLSVAFVPNEVADEPLPWAEDRSRVPDWADVYWGETLLGRMMISAERQVRRPHTQRRVAPVACNRGGAATRGVQNEPAHCTNHPSRSRIRPVSIVLDLIECPERPCAGFACRG